MRFDIFFSKLKKLILVNVHISRGYLISMDKYVDESGCELSNVFVLKFTQQMRYCHTIVRDMNSSRGNFVFYADRVNRLLIEAGLNLLPMKSVDVKTPTGETFSGCEPDSHICAIPILRSGESMVKAIREVCRDVRVVHILIQRNEKTLEPKLIYAKNLKDIGKRYCLLLDPMLATGGSACKAIETLKNAGVEEDHIIFLNMIATMNGITAVIEKYPNVQIITSCIDPNLSETGWILPGVGDFGDRYFGTDE